MSADEIFEVVDEHDQVIGHKPRREVHQLGLRHRAVHILVYNQRGQLFLQKRSLSKDCFPGTWDSSAAGHLAPGESYAQCALRELEEELSLTPAHPPQALFKIAACAETGQEFVWVYRCQEEGPFRLQAEEIETGDWFNPDQVSRWVEEKPADFAPGFVLIWRKLSAEGQKD